MNEPGEPRLALRDVRRMLEGVIPPSMCTVSADGVPHVNYLSQAEYVDEDHIATSFQFFNRSRQNVLATGCAALSVEDPYTGGAVTMKLQYERTDTAGAVFERLRAKLAGIASQSGMDKVFKLQGADIYRVLTVERVGGRRELPAAQSRCNLAAGARALSDRLARCSELDVLLDTATAGLRELLAIQHAMLLLIDRPRSVFYTVASIGYPVSGVGAELPLDHGLAGVAAREATAIRIGHMTTMAIYGRAARERTTALGLDGVLDEEIPLPGLDRPRSQLAVPMTAAGRTLGVLLVESTEEQFFSYDDEDALALLGGQLASAITLLQARAEAAPAPPLPAATTAAAPEGAPLTVRRVARDHSVFFDNEYVIKGVAGAILWKLLGQWRLDGRTDVTNRELRAAADELGLPEVQDNLEVRLLLLQRRLDERDAPVRLRKQGRGRWRLEVARPLRLDGA